MDNGSPFISHQLQRICAVLGIRLVHSKPGRPEGRGKIERFFATVRAQFLVEIADNQLDSLEELNRLFTAWVEQVYHRRIVRTTGQSPLERWLAGPSTLRPTPDPDALSQAFWWTVQRTVAATRTVSLHGNLYEVDPALVGRRIQLRYDPTDLAAIHVFDGDTQHGIAVPAQLRTHVDPKLRGAVEAEPGPATGIAYLDTLVADHAQTLRGQLTYQPPDHDDEEQPR